MDLFIEYLKIVNKNLANIHKDNWDYNRYGNEPKRRVRLRVVTYLKNILNRRGYFDLSYFIKYSADSILKFKYLFDNLEDLQDKELLLQVMAYKWLGYKKIKLPLNTPEYWNTLKRIEALEDKTDVFDPGFGGSKLGKFDLMPLGYPIQFYYSPLGVMIDFFTKQYEFNNGSKIIKAEIGNIVVDAGGCWGDTALYFANEVGVSGNVYSFEFIPNNITLFEKNISMNKELNKRIELVKNPVWENSSTKIYYKDNGPGSKVSTESFEGQEGECMTLSIDDLVKQKGIEKLDFIKMDIEGAETIAIKGAELSIKKFRPKLAIALYHSIDDFEKIPKMIKKLVPEYKFYFSHSTIYGEESMLFAIVD
jgi:FkbM family methyltransferase